MGLLEGKSSTERNKIYIAGVLGLLALVTLYFAFGRGTFGGSSTTVTVKASPSPSPRTSTRTELSEVRMPSQNDQDFAYQTMPVFYRPGLFGAPDPGRNIFAFYEPPPPCRPGIDCPVPTPTPIVITTPIPTPTPHLLVGFVTPQSVYSGGRSFRIEVNGDRFTPDSKIYLSQRELATTFISPQRLTAEVPANMIVGEGPRQIIVQTPDGQKYSNQIMFIVQAPPKPSFQYIGMIARRLANNDTAVFREEGKPTEFSARLNDIVGGRFRLVSISSVEVIVEDTNLGFKHNLQLYRPPPGTVISSGAPNVPIPGAPNFPQRGGQLPPGQLPQGSIPGIPDDIPRYVPPGSNTNSAPRPPQPQRDTKQDDDDDGIDNR